ncbi:MAG: Stk1 family PASTA domain-containing Ser/Thr kinase [Clostridia bacterium]|nr:Stk1 family PASTA domain-containing Ser/Thr kinase [Clostridia bacterium]
MVGTVLGNRYDILEQVGSGGMAVVYKAKDKLLNRYVAVKVLRSEFKDDEEFIRRFNIESQAAASLSHQNIVPIYDVGQQDGVQYIVMEYIEGITLKEYIMQKRGSLYWKEATDISMQICSALEHAHGKHIIHRDIKPQNIIMTKEGQVKVTDFGIARAANNNTTNLSGAAIGSAQYISPEQARGGYTDGRSDIYSLGVVMYELYTGRLPFDGDNPVAVAMQHIQKPPKPPTDVNPAIPLSIEKIILKAMSKEQRLRYETAAQMLADIKRVYMDPEAKINTDVPAVDEFGTRKMPPLVNIVIPATNEEKEETDKRATVKTETETKKSKTNEDKRKDRTAVAVAITTSLLLIAVIAFIAIRFAGNGSQGGVVTVPNLMHLTLDKAQSEVENTGFTIAIEAYQNSSTVAENEIISQTPDARSTVDAPCEIRLVVSSGVASVLLEDYTGQDYRVVQNALTDEDVGLVVVITMEQSDTVPGGIILRQTPAVGTELKTGEKITLFVSSGTGEDMVNVPSLINHTEAEARVTIERAGLVLGSVIPYQSDSVRGLVVNQSLVADTLVPSGSEIDIFVSTGAEVIVPTPTPTPTPTPQQTKYMSLTLPQTTPSVRVRIVGGDKILYDKEHQSSEGSIDVPLSGNGTIEVSVYFNGVLEATREVNFD